MYKLKYLTLAQKDLENIVTYISDSLKAPKAAMDLVDNFDKSISKLKQFPYSYKVYEPIKNLESQYRVLPVKNYLVFYTVNGEIVEIHRIIYGKMDINKVVK